MGKVVLVTGGSRGIGAATAAAAAERGYAVCVNYRSDRGSAEEVAGRIVAKGGEAMAFGADVSREEQVMALFAAIDERFGPLNALVNNAATLERQTAVAEIGLDRLERIFRTNVFGSFLCAREAVRRMSTKRGGRGGSIVNVSSVAARLGAAGEYVDYAASKGAVDTLTTGLAREVAGEGIRVNGVRPGYIYTDMHRSGGEPGRVDRVKGDLPMRRGGQPEEVARAILWLLSDEASYVTGSTIDLAGGR